MVFLKQSFDHNFFLIKFGQNLSVGSLLPLGQVPAPTGLLRTLAGLPLSLTPGASVQSLLLGKPLLRTALPPLVSLNLSCTLTGDRHYGAAVTRVAGTTLGIRALRGVCAGHCCARNKSEVSSGQVGREPGASPGGQGGRV